MATEQPPGNPAKTAADRRHVYGPRPIGALVPGITRPAFRARAPAAAQVMADWAAIVGPALSAVTAPRRLTSGTLTLACSGPIALELQHLSGQLIERVNAFLGRALIQRLRFVQDAPPPTRPRLAPRGERRAPVAVPGVPPGALHDALAALGATLAAAEVPPGGAGRGRAADPA